MIKQRKLLSFALAAGIAFTASAANAESDYNNPESYAQDKLVNAQAQLDRLTAQKKALNKLILAVKRDLKAAKIRAKAERVQQMANTNKEDAAVLIEQAGIAVDLPDLMQAKDVQAGLAKGNDKENIDAMFKDKNSQASEAVFYPAGSTASPAEYLK